MAKRPKYEVIERQFAFSADPFPDHTYGLRDNREEALDFAESLKYNAYSDDLIIVYLIEPDEDGHFHRSNGHIIYEERGNLK